MYNHKNALICLKLIVIGRSSVLECLHECYDRSTVFTLYKWLTYLVFSVCFYFLVYYSILFIEMTFNQFSGIT